MTERDVGTNGLGRETLFLLGSHSPSRLIFTGRNVASSEKVMADFQARFASVDISFVPIELASLDSVRRGARAIIDANSRLDLLFAVAGIMGAAPGLTSEGFEIHFGVNHLGHALLIRLLLPLLQSSTVSDGRIVIYSSDAARTLAPSCGIDFSALRTTQDDFWILGSWRRNGQSKLANALYARALAKHYPDILSVSIHPGIAYTNLVESLGFLERLVIYATTQSQKKSPKETAYHGLWAATAPRLDGRGEGQTSERKERLGTVENGRYYRPIGQLDTVVGLTTDDNLRDKLWDWTEKELQPWMDSVE